MPTVVGFANANALQSHFAEHGHDFGATTKEEYLALAKTFLEADIVASPEILECTRRNGDIVRFNIRTDEFAIMSSIGIIKTYFKPLPNHLAPPGTSLYKTHPHPNNRTYFRTVCRG